MSFLCNLSISSSFISYESHGEASPKENKKYKENIDIIYPNFAGDKCLAPGYQ